MNEMNCGWAPEKCPPLVKINRTCDTSHRRSATFTNCWPKYNAFGVIWTHSHRRTSQGAGGCSPPDSGKTIFRAKAIFFGQKPTAKNGEKKIFVCIYYTKKTEFIPCSEIKCTKSGIFLLIITGRENDERDQGALMTVTKNNRTKNYK